MAMSKYLDSGNTGHMLAPLNSQYHAIMNKYPQAGTVVQKVYKIIGDIEILAGCTPAKVGESIIVNNAKVWMGNCFLAHFTAYIR
jgi:hypothetical protein